jgi:hypothetical protein
MRGSLVVHVIQPTDRRVVTFRWRNPDGSEEQATVRQSVVFREFPRLRIDGREMTAAERGRLVRSASFLARLNRVSAKGARSWRRAEKVGRDIDLFCPDLDQALSDAERSNATPTMRA